jgi:large subunit GTPase 1
MPAFGGSKGEMVLGGILPIDQLTDYGPASELLVQRITNRKRLERMYGISLADGYTHDDLLSSYAAIRGFMSVRGLPDSSRAARIILKDYVNGKLRYCKAPPSVSQDDFQADAESDRINDMFEDQEQDDDEHRRPPTLRPVNAEKRLDSNFFAPATATVHFKGRQQVPSGIASSTAAGGTGNVEKPWRKHNNKNKKEKLRRVYRHLDVE